MIKDEIERRLASAELLLEVMISVLPAEQISELRRRLAEVDGLDDDGRSIVGEARRMAALGEQIVAQPATLAAEAAGMLASILKRRSGRP